MVNRSMNGFSAFVLGFEPLTFVDRLRMLSKIKFELNTSSVLFHQSPIDCIGINTSHYRVVKPCHSVI